jgi:hypothetical protein
MQDPQIKIIVGDLENVAEKVIKALTLEVTAELQESTPIDTGWARANWVPKIGEPSTESRPKIEANLPSAQVEQQKGLGEVLSGFKLSRGLVSIANNVPYIKRLNEGSSKQAPAAFVQQAISRAVQKVVAKTF